MRLLVAGGDVGGVRGLVSVARQALADGVSCGLVRHGALPREWSDGEGDWLDPATIDWPSADAFLFSSSVADPLALALAKQAAAQDVPTFHLLDHWSNYRARLTGEGTVFLPHRYFVMDELARTEAIADGVPAEILQIVGQPALCDLAAFVPTMEERDRGSIIFIGEPVAADQGRDPSSPAYRGYTEVEAVALFAETLSRQVSVPPIRLLPHPRQDPEEFAEIWHRHGRGLPAEIAAARRGRDLFSEARGLVGMASMLLYEGWLCGLPVLSLQPNRRKPHLDVLMRRAGAWVVDRADQADAAIEAWLGALSEPCGSEEQGEAVARHAASPRRVLSAIIADLTARRAE